MKEVVMVKTKTAVIIISILLLIIGIAVFNYFDKIYQKETETYPRLSVYYKDKEIGKFIVTSANWLYKGDGEYIEPITDLDNYEFPEESIVLIGNNDRNYSVRSDFRYKTLSYSDGLKKVNGMHASSGNGSGDFSKLLENGMLSMSCTNGIDEYIYTCNFTYNQGYTSQAIKVISFDQKQAEIAKNYRNTSLTDTNKIEELLKNTKYGPMFNSCKVDGKNLTIEYKFHIKEDMVNEVKMNNLVLFACIPELETITYSPENKKTFYIDYESTNDEDCYETVNEEVDKRVYTREQTNTGSQVNIDNFIKFMEQI